jgi:hypothetical protein
MLRAHEVLERGDPRVDDRRVCGNPKRQGSSERRQARGENGARTRTCRVDGASLSAVAVLHVAGVVALALGVLVSRRRLLKEIHPSPSVARLLQGWVPGLKPLLSCLISPCKIKFEYTTPMKISTPQLNKGLMRIESSTHRRRRPPITLPTTVLQQLLRVFYAAYILRLCVANRLAVSVANRLGPSLNPRRTISRLVPPTAAPPAPSPPPPPAPGSAPSGVAPAAESVLRRRPPA